MEGVEESYEGWGETYEYDDELDSDQLKLNKIKSGFAADLSSFKKSSDGCYIFMTADEVKNMIP